MDRDRTTIPRNPLIQFSDLAIQPGYLPSSSSGGEGNWLPPTSRNAFRIEDQTAWLRWTGHSLDAESRYLLKKPVVHSEATLIWDPQRNAFLHVPYDCVADDVGQQQEMNPRRGWQPLSFETPRETVRKKHPRLVLVGSNLRDRCVTAPSSDSWEEYLSPTCFRDGSYLANASATCDLAGNLAILYGLVALASPWSHLMDMFPRSLIPAPNHSYVYVPTWRRGISATECKPRYRGIIVKVGYTVEEYSKDAADAYERGHHGPILVSDPRNNRSVQVPGFAVHHTYHQIWN